MLRKVSLSGVDVTLPCTQGGNPLQGLGLSEPLVFSTIEAMPPSKLTE